MSSRMKKFLIALSIIAAGSLVIAISLFYSTGGLKQLSSSTNDISQTEEINALGIKEINISSVSTPVKVITNDGDKIKADLKGKIKTNIGGKTPELSIHKVNEELDIEIIYPSVVGFGFFDISELSLEISIPRDIKASAKISTTSAKIEIKEIRIEELITESVSGAIDVNNIESGRIEIKNTSGRCLVNDSAGTIHIKTVSGEALVNLKELKDDIDISSVSGAVSLTVPEDSSFIFDLSSVSGKIENNFNAKVNYADRQGIKGNVDSGDFDININTTSGRILLDYK